MQKKNWQTHTHTDTQWFGDLKNKKLKFSNSKQTPKIRIKKFFYKTIIPFWWWPMILKKKSPTHNTYIPLIRPLSILIFFKSRCYYHHRLIKKKKIWIQFLSISFLLKDCSHHHHRQRWLVYSCYLSSFRHWCVCVCVCLYIT